MLGENHPRTSGQASAARNRRFTIGSIGAGRQTIVETQLCHYYPIRHVGSQSRFTTEEEQQVAKIAYQAFNRYEQLLGINQLLSKQIQQEIMAQAVEGVTPVQDLLTGVIEKVNVATIVEKTTELVVQQTIDIPRILVVPKGEVTSGFNFWIARAYRIRKHSESCVSLDILLYLRTHS